jgi:hypothetical protein
MRDSTGSPKAPKADMAYADESKGLDYPDAPPNGFLHDVPEERGLNVSSILKGTAANRLTLFEKKAALINA